LEKSISQKIKVCKFKEVTEDLEVTWLEINLKKLQLLIPWDLGDYNIQSSYYYYF
jgi:hypothetical protein